MVGKVVLHTTGWLNSVAFKYGVQRFKYIEAMSKETKTENTQGNGDLAVVSESYNNGMKEVEGFCDDNCDAVVWENDTCKFVDICPLGCGTVWSKGNSR